jgi:hypothetical protein
MPIEAEPTPPRPATRLIALSVAVGALLAIVVIGGLTLALGGDDQEPVAHSSASPMGADAEALADLTAELDVIEGRIRAGDLEPASDALDRIRAAAADEPTLRTRVERLDRRLLVERLVASASKFEQEGDIAAAVGAYRDALQADPTHEPSRSALSRLSVKGADDQSLAADAYGQVEITSRPTTQVLVDGAPVGTTPFRGKLPVGRHEIRMTARGYEAWSGTLEVAAEDNTPLSVQLRSSGKSDRGRDKLPRARGSTPAIAPTSPPPDPDSGKSPAAADKPERKSDDTFLPTKKPSKGNDPFLPTPGDAP